MKEVYVSTRDAWRKWLAKNHNKSSGIWLVFYKKHTDRPSLDYDAVVEEALCYGWIDSIIKKLDGDRYARKLTPRKPDSCWSDLNKKRVKSLIRRKRMTKFGLERIEQAKQSGAWSQSNRPEIPTDIPAELEQALSKNSKAKTFFEQLAPSYRMQFIGWVASAKRQETRDRRVKESLELLKKGKKLGMKYQTWQRS